MFVDFVINTDGGTEGHGPVGSVLGNMRFDPGLLRPYIDDQGRQCCTVNTGQQRWDKKAKQYVPVFKKVLIKQLRDHGIDHPIYNAVSMRKDDWIQLDRRVLMAARLRLRAADDLKNANSITFNAMAKATYEYEAMSDPGEAVVDMDGLAEGRTDEPLFKLKSIPLPITHADFWFSSRRIAISRNSGTPVSTATASSAGRRVAEMIEKTTIGVETGMVYGPTSSTDTRYTGTSAVYGYTNFPDRITKTDLTTPTGSNPEAVKQDVIEMRELAYAAGFFGPFVLYHTPAYDQWLDDDYFRTGSTAIQRTLRERIMSIEGITSVRRLDFWTGGTYQLLLVQMTDNVCEFINGMEITTVMWESQGGARQNFKVMAIQVPLMKSDYNGDTGIVHGTTS